MNKIKSMYRYIERYYEYNHNHLLGNCPIRIMCIKTRQERITVISIYCYFIPSKSLFMCYGSPIKKIYIKRLPTVIIV